MITLYTMYTGYGGVLRDLRFPPAFKIGTCLEKSEHPFPQDVWGAAVLNVDATI